MQQDDNTRLSLLDALLAVLAGAAAMAVYVCTLAPTVYGEDAGELIAAAYTLGIPHPTGYPLWCLIAHAFIRMLSVGDVAWRVNLVSAFFGGATVAVAALIMRAMSIRRWAAFAGALALAFSLELWEQSVIAEVYTLSAFLIALCLLFIILWGKRGQPVALYTCGLCFGLGSANHQVIALTAPVLVVYALIVGGVSRNALKHYAAATLFAALGLSVYLYLPIRAMAHPPMNWGDPETLGQFWDVVTRAQFRFIITDNPRSMAKFGEQVAVYGHTYLSQFTPVFGWLALLGVVALAVRRQQGWSMLFAQFVVLSIGCIVIPNFALERKDIWLNTTYWIPAYLIAAVFIAAGIDWVGGLVKSRPWSIVAAAVLIAAAGGAPLAAHFVENDKSDFLLARDHAVNILNTMDPNAVYFADGDHMIFPVAYLQIVEDIRKDVLIANLYGYPTEETLRPVPEELRKGMARIPTESDEQVVFEWYLNHVDRPVYTSIKRRASGWEAKDAGILYRMVRKGEATSMRDDWGRYTWRGIDSERFPSDWTSEQIHFDYYFSLGRAACANNDQVRARWAYAGAAMWARESKDLLNNLACAAAECGLDTEAFAWFGQALEIDPTYRLVRYNLIRLCVKRERFEEGLALLNESLAIDPTDELAIDMKARVLQLIAATRTSASPQ